MVASYDGFLVAFNRTILGIETYTQDRMAVE